MIRSQRDHPMTANKYAYAVMLACCYLQITWNMFPIVYFASIDGYLSVNVIEPLWACLDW
jgi:hypothetical protein